MTNRILYNFRTRHKEIIGKYNQHMHPEYIISRYSIHFTHISHASSATCYLLHEHQLKIYIILTYLRHIPPSESDAM